MTIAKMVTDVQDAEPEELKSVVLRMLVLTSSAESKEVLGALSHADQLLGHTTCYDFYISVIT